MNQTVGDRIGLLIEKLEIKKVRFAERIKVDQSFVTQLVNNKRNPSDRTIADICREWEVNESWLRTGNGEMFRTLSKDEKIAAFLGKVMREEGSYKKMFISVLAQLGPEEWATLEKIGKALLKEEQGMGK